MYKYLRNSAISMTLFCAVGATWAMEWERFDEFSAGYFDNQLAVREPDNEEIIKRLTEPSPGAEKMSSDYCYLKALQKSIELQEAIDQQNLEAVKALIEEQGIDFAFVLFGSNEETNLLPLSQAIRSGAVDIVKYLISINAARGRNCSIYVPETLQPGKATDEQRLECAKMLIENGSRLPSHRGFFDLIAKSCYRQLKNYLLANIKFQHACCITIDMNSAKEALEGGAYINLRMVDDLSALYHVVFSAFYHIVFNDSDQKNFISFLLERGAAVSSEAFKSFESLMHRVGHSYCELTHCYWKEKNFKFFINALAQRTLDAEVASKESYLGKEKLSQDLREELLNYIFSSKEEESAKKAP